MKFRSVGPGTARDAQQHEILGMHEVQQHARLLVQHVGVLQRIAQVVEDRRIAGPRLVRAALADHGGGMVVFPTGRWLTGTITLKDQVYLRLDPGAVLLGSKDINDYNPKVLLSVST